MRKISSASTPAVSSTWHIYYNLQTQHNLPTIYQVRDDALYKTRVQNTNGKHQFLVCGLQGSPSEWNRLEGE